MNNWFESRNLKVLAYQTDTINKVKDSLSSQEITVLAACPSAGKTIHMKKRNKNEQEPSKNNHSR